MLGFDTLSEQPLSSEVEVEVEVETILKPVETFMAENRSVVYSAEGRVLMYNAKNREVVYA